MGIGTGLAQQVKDLYRGVGPLGIRVIRPENANDLRALAAAVNMFTVSGGDILLTSIYGKVTADMEDVGTLITLQHTPTAGGAVDMCDASLTLTGDDINTLYHITGAVAVDMEPSTGIGVGEASFETNMQILVPGIISLQVEGVLNADGIIRWSLHYVPLEAASRVTWIV